MPVNIADLRIIRIEPKCRSIRGAIILVLKIKRVVNGGRGVNLNLDVLLTC